jgi:uncharacterized membrane protein
MTLDMSIAWLILAAGVATYLTRIGGYLLIRQLKTIPPRLQAALDAVPAAVLTTLVAPTVVSGGWDVRFALLVALLVSLRFPGIAMLGAGWLAAMAARHLFGF